MSPLMDHHKPIEIQANCYVTKPQNYEEFINVVRSVEEFWATIVELPAEN